VLENNLRHYQLPEFVPHLSVWSPLEEFPFEVPLSLWVARYSRESRAQAMNHLTATVTCP